MLAVRALPRRGRPSRRAPRRRAGPPLPLRAAARALRRAPVVAAAGRPTTRRSWAPRWAGCCAPRRRSTSPTWRCRACRCRDRLAVLRGAAAPRRVLVRRGRAGRRPHDRRGDRCSRCSSSTSAARPPGSRRSRSARSPSAPRRRRRPCARPPRRGAMPSRGRCRRDRARPPDRGAAVPRAGPGPRRASSPTRSRPPRRTSARRSASCATRSAAAAWCCARSRAASRSPRTPTPRRPRGGCWPAPRTPSLTPAQAETLSIVAYLQPVSRPEVARIRGVASESATAALTDRGLIEESGRSQFGAVLYRTTPLFLKLFGLQLGRRPARPVGLGPEPRGRGRAARPAAARGRAACRGRPHRLTAAAPPGLTYAATWRAASCPHAASMSRPRVSRTVAGTPCSSSAALNASIASREEPS